VKNDLEHRLLIAAGQQGFGTLAHQMGVEVCQVSRIFGHTQGIPIDRLERLLVACGMQVVSTDAVVMDRAAWDEHQVDYEAMRRLLAKSVAHDQTLSLPAPLVGAK
jgi:hypothetical protein